MEARRVLIVEDDAMIGLLLTEILAGMGHEVCATAATEADALAAAIRYRPELMIVDGRLGQGSGVSAVEEILRAGSLPHIFLSGDPEKIKARRPAAVVVRKPFRQIELVRAIERALGAAAAA
jgi:CheY-like chemotaxis protein